jgi:hypothetical protein
MKLHQLRYLLRFIKKLETGIQERMFVSSLLKKGIHNKLKQISACYLFQQNLIQYVYENYSLISNIDRQLGELLWKSRKEIDKYRSKILKIHLHV